MAPKGGQRPRRVLMVAYRFPPSGGIGSIRAAGFARHLPEVGWEPTVLAPRTTAYAVDPLLAFPEEGVVRSPSIEFGRLARAQASNGGSSPRSGEGLGQPGMRATLKAAAHRFVYFPDPQIGWYPGAVLAGLKLLRRERFDVIYSSSGPITAHLVAGTLSRRGGIPWVAEFRDPWSDLMSGRESRQRRARRLENRIANSAAGIVVPTPTLGEHWSARWQRPVAVIPNGHDLDGARGLPPARQTITHLGTYHPARQSLTALWTALERYARDGGAGTPLVRFVGELPHELRAEIDQTDLDAQVEVTGLLPHPEAMEAMRSSSILVASACVGDDPISQGVIPAKLFEYLASGLPILYLGSMRDDAGRLLSGFPGCHIVDPDDVAGVLAVLRSEGGRLYERDTDALSRRARTGQLADVLGAASTPARQKI